MNTRPARHSNLTSILASARSGALDHAWREFKAAGFGPDHPDPAVHTLYGRLLKDRALRTSGEARQELFAEAADAYARADALAAAPYHLINVATMRSLAGAQGEAAQLAADVISRIDSGGEIADTPYFIEATRAEALLLQRDIDAATTTLRHAMTLGSVHEDHAVTLRQLNLICEASDLPCGWLDAFRPPASLHFAGHLGVAAHDAANADLVARIDSVLDAHRVGFGYGALAAGSDILIAERLLARGAELHIMLPMSRAAFRAASVEPWAEDWAERFEACIAAAASVREVSDVTGRYDPIANTLASELSMGAAVLNARLLESRAVQLLIADDADAPFGTGKETARDGETWQEAGRIQEVIRWPRQASTPAAGEGSAGEPGRRVAALLFVGFAGIEAVGDAEAGQFVAATLDPLEAALAALAKPPFHISRQSAGYALAFDAPEDAAAAALALRDAGRTSTSVNLRISGHYGIVLQSAMGLYGTASALPEWIDPITQPGAIFVTADFATALFGRVTRGYRTEFAGEHLPMRGSTPVELYALMEG